MYIMPKKFKLNDLGNPLLAGYDLGYNVIGPAIAGKGRNDDIIRPIVKMMSILMAVMPLLLHQF